MCLKSKIINSRKNCPQKKKRSGKKFQTTELMKANRKCPSLLLALNPRKQQKREYIDRIMKTPSNGEQGLASLRQKEKCKQ